MDIQIGNPNNIYLLACVAMGVVVTAWAIVARRRAASRFSSVQFRDQLIALGGTSRQVTSAALVSLSLTLLVLSLIDVRWGKSWREVPQKGIEVMFVLDVSRSMLAEDTSPNRLRRAKQQIRDMVDEMAGDRVGLVAFAGETRQSVPLTSHYEDFLQTLDSVGPHTVRSGGSRLGDAISAAASGFLSKTNDHQAIVIFTDGEDQESDPVAVAKKLHAEKGIRVFTIGLGDVVKGARIPDPESRRGGYVQYQGEPVWSKMNGQILMKIATETNGAYVPAGTRQVNMADVYHRYVANVPEADFKTAKINSSIARYQWFALPALALLLLEVFLSTTTPKSGEKRNDIATTTPIDRSSAPNRPVEMQANKMQATTRIAKLNRTALVLFSIGAVAPVVSPQSAVGQSAVSESAVNASVDGQVDPAVRINAANALLREGKFDDAVNEYQRVQPTDANRIQLDYNLAVALFRKGDTESARALFGKTAGASDAVLASNSRYNLGNCLYRQAVALAEEDKGAAVEMLREAISHYRGALRGELTDIDARANIELAGQLIRQLQDEEQKQEDQDSKEQPNPDQEQDTDQKPNPDQPQSSDAQQDSAQQENEPQSSDSDPEQTESPQPDEPAKGDNQNQPDPQHPSDNQNRGGTPEQQPQDEKPQDEQSDSDDSDSDDSDSRDSDSGDEGVPSGELTSSSQPDPNDKPGTSVAAGDQNQKAGMMTREEAQKLLQAVRDRDMLRRWRREQLERTRHVPVDRDW